MQRREFLKLTAVCGMLAHAGRGIAGSAEDPQRALIAAAWRGPNPTDTYHAGVLVADWARKKLEIAYSVPLPTRPHGLTPEADGSLLVVGVRPGTWLMRIAPDGQVASQLTMENEASVLLNGHVAIGQGGDVVYTTETDFSSGHGKIGVRDRVTFKKLDEWESGGKEPHQLLIDDRGRLVVANGGIARTRTDQKYDLARMDSSLTRLDERSGKILQQWTAGDSRLSLRHLAWSEAPDGTRRLGIAMQAEHDSAEQRRMAPILAVLEGDELRIPSRSGEGVGYAGDLAAAYNGGFVLSSNQVGRALLWHPGAPEKLVPVVELPESYAMAEWHGPKPGGGVLVSTALGMVRWHPTAKPIFLAWPKPMALDNHWTLMQES
ncbi:DUF1513 domain-containing protein [Azonexus sp. IMCC34839]|uniref:DUF1513 domain-containing protein n=1 Tax=Azonexus sp. IMCC34839 TaxID=3133695 RepID=UPI0039996D17